MRQKPDTEKSGELSPGLGKQISPSFGKLSWLGPTLLCELQNRLSWADSLRTLPQPQTGATGTWVGCPPLLGAVGCECHHPRRPEGRRHNWGRGRRELGRTFKPDTTLSTSKLQSLNESQGRSYCEVHIDDLVFKSPKESQTDLSNGFRASLTQREGFQVRRGQFLINYIFLRIGVTWGSCFSVNSLT